MPNRDDIAHARQLSPLRNSTGAASVGELVEEQLRHFAIDPDSDYGRALSQLTASLYGANAATHDLVAATGAALAQLDRKDRVAWFNAKRFACFQLAKVLDNLQGPMRRTYQSLAGKHGPRSRPRPLSHLRQRDRDLFGHAGHHPHRDLSLCLRRVGGGRLQGQGAAARDLFAPAQSHLRQPRQSHRRCRGGSAGPRILRLELQFRHGRRRLDPVAFARLPGHRAGEPQHLWRQLPAAARLVWQAQQSRYRRALVRRLYRRRFCQGARRRQDRPRRTPGRRPPHLCLSRKSLQSARPCA